MAVQMILLLAVLVAVITGLLTRWSLRSGSEGTDGVRLDARERRMAAAALEQLATTNDEEAAALGEAGFGAARQIREAAEDMRALARRIDPDDGGEVRRRR